MARFAVFAAGAATALGILPHPAGGATLRLLISFEIATLGGKPTSRCT